MIIVIITIIMITIIMMMLSIYVWIQLWSALLMVGFPRRQQPEVSPTDLQLLIIIIILFIHYHPYHIHHLCKYHHYHHQALAGRLSQKHKVSQTIFGMFCDRDMECPSQEI